MTQPPPYPPADPYGTPTGGWPAPTWAPAWEPPPGSVPFGAAAPGPAFHPPAPRSQNRGAVVALVAAGGALVGAVVAGLLVAVLFSAAAENIGRGMGEEFSQSVGGAGVPPEGMWSSEYATSGPIEEHPPIDPGPLGHDPVLDAYADNCFAGEMQACDDLFFESPPMSGYEEYGVTCGGRVKQFDVMACTDLD